MCLWIGTLKDIVLTLRKSLLLKQHLSERSNLDKQPHLRLRDKIVKSNIEWISELADTPRKVSDVQAEAV